MLRIKAGATGARLSGLRVEILAALMVAVSVYDSAKCDLLLTCGTDSKHMATSLHYVGLAIDIALPNAVPVEVSAIKQALEWALGDDYDLVVEEDHWHIEFQPKRGVNL
jgi:hypothetical protein